MFYYAIKEKALHHTVQGEKRSRGVPLTRDDLGDATKLGPIEHGDLILGALATVMRRAPGDPLGLVFLHGDHHEASATANTFEFAVDLTQLLVDLVT